MRGADKLLQEVDGQPVLRCLAQRGLSAGLQVFVTLAPDQPARRAALADLDVTVVEVPNAEEGMSQSLRAGAHAMPPEVDGMMVLPGDMPDIQTADMAALAQAFLTGPPCPALRATTQDGQPGHPIVFARDQLALFDSLDGDRGAFMLLKGFEEQVRLVPLPGDRARLDLDTPEDWAAWRARNADTE